MDKFTSNEDTKLAITKKSLSAVCSVRLILAIYHTSKIWALTAEKIAKIYPDVIVNYVSLSCVISTIIQQPTSLDVVVAPKWVDQILNEESQKITGLPETVPVSMKNNNGQMLYQLPQINVDDKNLMMTAGEGTAKLILKECFKHYDNL